MKITVQNTGLAIETEDAYDDDRMADFVEATTYMVKGAWHDQAYKQGRWDGKERLIEKVDRFVWSAPVGVLADALELFPHAVVVDDRRHGAATPDLYLDPEVIPSLRPYQRDAVEAVTRDRGVLTGKGLLRLPTRSGKTVIAAAIIAQTGMRSLFVVNSDMLLRQTVTFFSKALKLRGKSGKANRRAARKLVGQFGGGVYEVDAHVTVASVQGLMARGGDKAVKGLLAVSQCTFFDECFVASTPVHTPTGTVPIEMVKAGDEVVTYDEDAGRFGVGRVVRAFKSPAPLAIYEVTIGGEAVRCTANHPWLTRRGWKEASLLTSGDEVLFLGTRASDPLQDRPRTPDGEGRGRAGRGEPRNTQGASGGPPKVGVARRAGVEGFPVQKWRRVERVRACPSGSDFVYNFEVEGTHTYVVGPGAVVHNCHHLEAPKWRVIMNRTDSPYKIGLSATIYLDKQRGTPKGTIWLVGATGPVLHSITPSELIEAGWLNRPEITFVSAPDPDGAIRTDAPFATKYKVGITENAGRNEKVVRLAAREVLAGRRVLVTVRYVAHVEVLARAMTALGLVVSVVTGKTPAGKRTELCNAVRDGEADVLVGTVFGEAVDLPWLETVIVADALASRVLAMQRLRNLTPVDEDGKALLTPRVPAHVVPVYDFADFGDRLLAEHSLKRFEAYRANPAFRVRWER